MESKRKILLLVLALFACVGVFILALNYLIKDASSPESRTQDIDKQFTTELLTESYVLNYFDDGTIEPTRDSQAVTDCDDSDERNLYRAQGDDNYKDSIVIEVYSVECEDLSLSSVNGRSSYPRNEDEIMKLDDGEILERFSAPLGEGYWFKETSKVCTNECNDYDRYRTLVVSEDRVFLFSESDNKGLSMAVAKTFDFAQSAE